jgi:hypothetical protein
MRTPSRSIPGASPPFVAEPVPAAQTSSQPRSSNRSRDDNSPVVQGDHRSHPCLLASPCDSCVEDVVPIPSAAMLLWILMSMVYLLYFDRCVWWEAPLVQYAGGWQCSGGCMPRCLPCCNSWSYLLVQEAWRPAASPGCTALSGETLNFESTVRAISLLNNGPELGGGW